MANSEKKTILVVDDEPDAVEFVTAIISDMGEDYSVISAFDGETGLQKARAESPDLIILDVMMPKKDGFNVFFDLGRYPETDNIPVIMLTGITEATGIPYSEKDMDEFLGREPEAYIEKPIVPEKIQEAIKKALKIES